MSSDVDALLSAAVKYYRHDAPCGDWPLLALRGFMNSVCVAMISAVSGNGAALIDSTNAAAVAALDVIKMAVKFYEKKGVSEP